MRRITIFITAFLILFMTLPVIGCDYGDCEDVVVTETLSECSEISKTSLTFWDYFGMLMIIGFYLSAVICIILFVSGQYKNHRKLTMGALVTTLVFQVIGILAITLQ